MWSTFEGVLSEAEQFVKTQTPMKAQGLQQSIEVGDHTSTYTVHVPHSSVSIVAGVFYLFQT